MAVWTLFRTSAKEVGEERALNELNYTYIFKEAQEPENEHMVESANWLRINQVMYYRLFG